MILAVMNEKGGVGKTTMSIHVANAIAERGSNVVIVDLDPQAHVSAYFGNTTNNMLYHLMQDSVGYDGAIMWVHAHQYTQTRPDSGVVCILPGGTGTSQLAQSNDVQWLYHLLHNGRSGFLDFDIEPIIVIDTPASYTQLQTAAFMAATHVVYITDPSGLGVAGLHSSIRHHSGLVNSMLGSENHSPDYAMFAGIIVNRYDARLKAHRYVVEQLKENEDFHPVYPPIPRSTVFEQSALLQRTLFTNSDQKSNEICQMINGIIDGLSEVALYGRRI